MSVPSDPRIYPRPAVFNQALEFYWQPPSSDGGSNISSYILECSNIGFISVLPSTSRKARVDNLPNQTTYLFTLKATNDFGNSNITSFRSVQPGFPPDLPSNLNVIVDLANSEPLLNVSLTQPDTTNSSNITYNALTMYPLDSTGNIIDNSPFMFKRFSLPGIFEPVTLVDTNTDYEYIGLIQSINDVRWSKNITYYNFRINPNLPTNNLKLWLDPYDSTVLTLSNNKVIGWNDKSINQSNATISETFAPTYDQTNDLLIFNGNQYMNLPANTIPSANTPYSMFIYASTSNINMANSWLLFSGSSSANLSLGAKFNNGNIIQSWFGTDLSGNLANFNAIVDLPILSTFTYDGNIRRTYVNGTLINSEIARNRNSGTGNNIIGSISTLNSNLFGSIGEIVLYDRLLTDRERTSLETFLINKRSNLSLKNYGNLTLWLDATDNNTLYNSNINEKISYHNPVSVWLDKSNNNNHAFQSNLAIAPLKKSTLGRDCLNFNSGFMISNIVSLPFDAFLIVQLNNLNQVNDVLGISPIGNNYNSLSYNITANRWSNDSTSNIFVSSNIETSTGYIMMEYSLANNNAFIRRNGSNIANITNFTWSLPNNSRLYIGNDNGITFNNSLKGNIGEIIMFNKQLNDNQRFPLEGYLAWKWGLQNNLPSSHLFKNKAPSLFNILSASSSSTSIRLLLPSDISGLSLWLDSNDSSSKVLNGSNITTINDKSGNGRNATASGSGIINTINAINGNTAMLFPGNSNYVYLSGNTTNGTPNVTIFIVATVNSDVIQYARLFGFGGSADYNNIGNMVAFNWNPSTLNGANGGLIVERNNIFIPTLHPITFSNSFIGVTQVENSTITGFINGTNTLTGTTINTNFTYSQYQVGSYTGFNGYTWPGYVGEILTYNKSLTLNERQQIEGYLAWKWGLQSNLPINHLFKNSAPIIISSNNFSPTNINGLAMWLDASDSSTYTISSGNFISSWSSKSTSPVITVSQPVSNFQPQRVTNVLNGLTVIRTSNPNSATHASLYNTSVASADLATTTSVCIFIVHNPTMNNGTPISYQNSGSNRIQFHTPESNSVHWDWNSGGPSNRLSYSVGGSYVSEGFKIECFYVASGVQGYRKNGQLLASIASTTASFATNQTLTVGGFSPDNATYFYRTDIAEIVWYKSTIDNNQIQQIEGYLAWKWGLQSLLPSNHSYKNAAP